MSTFAERLGTPRKVHNNPAARAAKTQLRSSVLVAIGASNARVFDAFAGPGEMYEGAWKHAAAYTGCDTERHNDGRLMFCADNRRVMRAIDLAAFNVFDFDAFGSPFEQLVIMAARRPVAPGERLGVCITDGSALTLKFGGLPHALMGLTSIRARMPGFNRWQSDIFNEALRTLCKRMGAKVLNRWEAEGRTGAKVRYIGLVLEGVK